MGTSTRTNEKTAMPKKALSCPEATNRSYTSRMESSSPLSTRARGNSSMITSSGTNRRSTERPSAPAATREGETATSEVPCAVGVSNVRSVWRAPSVYPRAFSRAGISLQA
eukprot:CAMPEP_0179016514 /NCGR_PEP_ID=MMETSP0796-20121207/3356_1 /TAXON_ID=73915 /ORGANISM="Pyrodinium bahamense, Strain pbaha01" /LENGTH=110 /DNA_ID=CAMNT_0020712201 /DNA_START=683 /DNA_END=1013 /DNA_ORIENTATION=+